jgi:hypothetical protein
MSQTCCDSRHYQDTPCAMIAAGGPFKPVVGLSGTLQLFLSSLSHIPT